MGRIIEFYAVDLSEVPGAPLTLEGVKTAGSILVATPTINSAAYPALQEWLLRTPLARLVTIDNPTQGVFVSKENLQNFVDGFPGAGPDGSDAIVIAAQDAAQEAQWYRRPLWIRMP